MAIFSNYSPSATSSVAFDYSQEFYRVITAGTGTAAGDVIRRHAQVNEATGVETGLVNWYNVSQDAVLGTAPTAADINALDSYRNKLGSQVLTVDATIGGVSLTVPAGANHAEIHVWDADVVFTLDGATAPTATVGIRQADGQLFELEGVSELTNAAFLRLGATDARIYVEYSTVYSNSSNA